MTKEKDFRGYLERYGERLIDNGYTIVPIQPGKKAPGFDGWQNARATKEQVREWLSHGHRQSGLGILTKNTPAIDLDIRDEDLSNMFAERAKELIGDMPVRVGSAPKALLLARTDSPFRKMRSGKWQDPEWCEMHQIEILGDGQQFVAFAIHPDTGKPYVWTEDESPLNVRAADLPTVSVEQLQELLDEFDAECKARGFELVKAGRRNTYAHDEDNPWLEDAAPVDITTDDLRVRLLLVNNPEDYDTWLQVGMALYHQYDGDEVGLALWHEWAETADNYDADALDRRWDDFGIQGKNRAPVTARTILKLAKEAVTNTTAALALKLHEAFRTAKDLLEWEKAREMAQGAEIDGLARSSLATTAKERRDALTGSKTSLTEIKKALAYRPTRKERIPGWAEPWVYDASDDRFFNTATKIATTKQGFDAMHDRYAMTKKDILDGRSTPSSSASDLALITYKIPVVAGRRYLPGRDAIFHEVDGMFANTYPEHEIPTIPEKLSPKDKINWKRVKAHVAHLFPKERDQRYVLDTLAWIVQNEGKRLNWALLIQGVEGDGKSFFAMLMRAVLGPSNVRMLNSSQLGSSFTDYLVGQVFTAIEEVRIKGKDKFDILNFIKPFITNLVIEVHPKGKAAYNAINTTNYFMTTNFKDAIPIDEGSRRFLVLFSQWQDRAKLAKFKEDNPDYYSNLYATIEESAGAIRHMLMQHEISDDFDPYGDAPMTEARAYMIRQAKPEFIQILDDIIADSDRPDISRELLNVTELGAIFNTLGYEFPTPKTLASMLQRDGYENLGRITVSQDSKARFWSKTASEFSYESPSGMTVNVEKIRKLLTESENSDLDL